MLSQRYSNKAEWRKLYATKQWRELRKYRLMREPVCRYCSEVGKHTPAEIVDHIEPHKGDTYKFFDYTNTQSLCKRCHDSVKQAYEKSGTMRGNAKDGMPLDPNHHWNGEGVGKSSK